MRKYASQDPPTYNLRSTSLLLREKHQWMKKGDDRYHSFDLPCRVIDGENDLSHAMDTQDLAVIFQVTIRVMDITGKFRLFQFLPKDQLRTPSTLSTIIMYRYAHQSSWKSQMTREPANQVSCHDCPNVCFVLDSDFTFQTGSTMSLFSRLIRMLPDISDMWLHHHST